MREVPASIPPTDYYRTGEPEQWDEPMVKSPDVIARMRVAGRVAAEVLAVTGAAVAPGVTTEELDLIAHQAYLERGAFPSTLNYHGYPKSICTSVNEVICHGIPDDRPLADGDIVNIDVTAYIDGVHGDCSATFYVGQVDPESRALVEVTRQCRDLGHPSGAAGPAHLRHRPGHRGPRSAPTVTVSCACSSATESAQQFHISPSVPHYYVPEASTVMEPGMTFTIEPMITIGTWREKMWDNGWTAVTADRKADGPVRAHRLGDRRRSRSSHPGAVTSPEAGTSATASPSGPSSPGKSGPTGTEPSGPQAGGRLRWQRIADAIEMPENPETQIYGTITAGALLAAEADRHETFWQVGGSVALALIVVWFAHAYATGVAARMHSGEGRPVHNLMRGMLHELALLRGAFVPLFVLLLSGLCGANLVTAETAALISAAVLLVVLEVAGRLEKLSAPGRAGCPGGGLGPGRRVSSGAAGDRALRGNVIASYPS